MNSKTLLLSITISCWAVVSSGPIIKQQPRNAVGTCPEVDPPIPVYFPDSESCSLYYECSAGEAIQNECPPDLEFNPKLNVCDFPSHAGCTASNNTKHGVRYIKPLTAVGSCPAVDPATPVYLPDSESCNLYYECSNGEAIQNECPPDLEFNPTINDCDFPDHAGCTASNNTRYSPQNIKLLTAVGSCPAVDPATPVYLPDSESCNLYYECSNGEAIQNECPPDLEFNPTINDCDFPDHAGCTASNSTKYDVVYLKPFSAVGTCPDVDPPIPVFLPDSESCNLYYECSNGEAIQNECPPDLEFNPTINDCDFPDHAGCSVTNSSMNAVEEQSIVVSFLPKNAVGTCPEVDPPMPIYFPDSESCSLYYECSAGVAIQNECPPDLEFNPKLHVCDFPEHAGCTSSNSSKKIDNSKETFASINIAPLTAVGTCPPRDTNVTIFLPDSVNCTIYYICSNGRPIQVSCAPGMSWSTELNTCDWDLNVECPNSKKSARTVVGTCPEVDPPMPVYFPDSESCSLYYECSGGVPIQNECPPDLEFNTKLNVCDFPLNAGCSITRK